MVCVGGREREREREGKRKKRKVVRGVYLDMMFLQVTF